MTGKIILAAGASTRLGQPKQNLEYKGKSLLKHAIDTAVNAFAGPVAVVIASNQKEIISQIETEPIIIVENSNWRTGMSTSIYAGLARLLQDYEDMTGVILMVCDQPFVNETLLNDLLLTKNETNKTIVACSYNDTVGVPALFDKCFFQKLLSLKGEEGGKKILMTNTSSVATVPFPAGSIDIDTMPDYQALLNSFAY